VNLDEHEKPRNERVPDDYANQILNSVVDSLVKLGRVKDEEEFKLTFFNVVVEMFATHGITADLIEEKIFSGELKPPGKFVDNRTAWAAMACAHCVEVFKATKSGDITSAWTHAMDARFAADALISQLLDLEAAVSARRSVGKVAASVKLANDPVQAAKTDAKKLWQERRDGKHPKLRTNDLFAAEAVRRWPVLKIGTVLKWCTAWEKEAKYASAS
jgi:hypothetical protein